MTSNKKARYNLQQPRCSRDKRQRRANTRHLAWLDSFPKLAIVGDHLPIRHTDYGKNTREQRVCGV